jgi:TfoX/Sxy family transcriptional regulator of competence genes
MSHHGGGERPSPKATDEAKAAFRELAPVDPRVTVRPMFGALAAFGNGQMFCGLFGDELFFRLGEADRNERLGEGWHQLEPMPGRPMREYVTYPGDWRNEPAEASQWAARALDYALSLPPKTR